MVWWLQMISRPALDPRSDVPLYRQLYLHFHGLIRAGLLETGERLPATRELAGTLGLNRTTVSAAYELLESEGLITGMVGRGSFVTMAGRVPLAGVEWERLLIPAASAPAPASVRPGTISFATSRPSEELFPVQSFREACEEVMSSPDLAHILQLGSPGGYEPLRQYLLAEARRRGIAKGTDDLIVTNGCQQALDLARRVLLGHGDQVAIEDPVYAGLKNLFASSAALLPVSVGRDGVDPDHLEKIFTRARPKVLVTIPNFQNPTGATIPAAARRAILRHAREAGVVIIENDTYGALRYAGEPQPSLKELDDSGRTILTGSFSKIAFPGLRIGWALGPRPLIERMMEAKHLSDLHTDQFSQAVLLRFAESGRLAAHQKRMLETGAERLSAVLAACEEHLPVGASFTRPQGGMNLWVRLPELLDAAELLPRAQREGVSYLPGKYFAVGRPEISSLRLSFAGLAPEEIREGVRILGALFRTELERARSRSAEPAMAVV